MFRFQSPYFFLLLIPFVVLVVVLEFRRRPVGVVFSDISLLKTVRRTLAQRIARFLPWLFYLGLVFLVIALARPQTGKKDFRIRAEGIALAMCIDRSASMAALDFMIDGHRVNRLEAVKKTFRDFVSGNGTLPGRKDDMIGLLAFGGYVDSFCPLTLDHATLLELLNQIQLPQPIFDNRGRPVSIQILEEESLTAIGDALAQAVDRLKESKAKSKVIILLSDGEQTFGTLTPQEGAEAAKALGIKIYSIGIGSTGPVPVMRTDPFGQKVLVQQNYVMDEKALREIAKTTGGLYFNAKNTQALECVYAEIDKLEKTVHEGRVYTQYTELYRYPLVCGMILILVQVLLAGTRFRRLP